MQTNIDFIQIGKTFPPIEERERIERYLDNELIYNSDLKPWDSQAERVRKSPYEPVTYETVLNFQKLISVKTADLLFEDSIKLEVHNNESQTEKLAEIGFRIDIDNKLYQSAIDVSRFGESIVLKGVQNGKGTFEVISPKRWIPVANPLNMNDITHHVIWWTDADTKRETLFGKTTYETIIQIHTKGEVRCLRYLGTQINENQFVLNTLISEEVYPTPFDDFAVHVIQAKKTTSQYFGEDDYTDINSIIAEMQVTIAQISRLQDKYTAPTIVGSMSLLATDKKGKKFFRGSEGFIPSETGNETKYLTPQLDLSSCFKKYDTLMNALATISEMGTLIVDFDRQTRANTSAKAMRLNYVSPLAKVNRYKKAYNRLIPYIFSQLAQVEGVYIPTNKIKLTFPDGLPTDRLEDAQIEEIRVRSGNTTTAQSMSRLDNINVYDAERYLENVDINQNISN